MIDCSIFLRMTLKIDHNLSMPDFFWDKKKML